MPKKKHQQKRGFEARDRSLPWDKIASELDEAKSAEICYQGCPLFEETTRSRGEGANAGKCEGKKVYVGVSYCRKEGFS